MRTFLFPTLLLCSFTHVHGQVLVDSIPYPGISQGFWGIEVNADTIFLGADFSGDIYFSDHAGTIIGQRSTGFTFNHGLIRKPSSVLIAQDYTTNGAHLYEVALDGTLLNTWSFPDVIGGHSSGIGGIYADGDAIWYTMYYPDFDTYPFAYAYKWIPGEPTPIDTVPMLGGQPMGIALKGDTLIYAMDNNDGDPERIYLYDLNTDQDIGAVDLPDMTSDGDQSPRGLFWDGEFLYLIATRSGGSAFAFQTIFKYAFDVDMAVFTAPAQEPFLISPSPAADHVVLNAFGNMGAFTVFDPTGRTIHQGMLSGTAVRIPVSEWAAGTYTVQLNKSDGNVQVRRFHVAH
ncbi:MAG: T9SS type A sorting domain-containing protein [Flavobacteriales bacterium]|nr:T9SS type A sorting domain-containing protein [Flavobacteriales bacterium]